jgi:O-antigen/teichoic acid export membrane protein
MTRSRREQLMFLFAILFAAAPFVAGSLRAFSTRSDFRMLWMALASLLGAIAVMAIGNARGRMRNSLPSLAVATFIVATLVAGSVAYLLGAKAAFGVWAVAVVLSFCCAASCVFYALSRQQAI